MSDWEGVQEETKFGPKFRVYRVGFWGHIFGVRLESGLFIHSGYYAARFFERGHFPPDLFYDWEYRALDDPWVKQVGIANG